VAARERARESAGAAPTGPAPDSGDTTPPGRFNRAFSSSSCRTLAGGTFLYNEHAYHDRHAAPVGMVVLT
jgi:hypothetical protein